MPASLPVRCTMVSIVTLRRTGTAAEALLLKRRGGYLAGIWSYVAGHLEAGETAWQAALRELREETGFTPRSFWATSCTETFYDRGSECIQLVPGFVAWMEPDAEPRLNAEHSAWRWLPFAEAMDSLPFGSQRELFAHVEREFIHREPAPALRINIGAGPASGPDTD